MFDGGWGTAEGFGSDVLDTAMALLALKAADVSDTTVLSKALSFLTRTQNVDGGLGLVSGDESRVFHTALALQALNAYRLEFALSLSQDQAISFLRNSQNPDGGYGDSSSTAFETSLVLLAILDAGLPLTPAETDAIDFLAPQQLTNGSWVDDVYSTALAVLALAFPKDSDADGMPDDFETANMLDPDDPTDAGTDLDSDGLTNLEEFRLGTNPKISDTDGDGVDDRTEVVSGSDPVDPTSLNQSPVITSQPVTTASEMVDYSYQVQADDPDGDALSFSILQSPAGMTIFNTGLIEWTPTAAQAGTFTVIVQASDGIGGTALQQYRVMVLLQGIDLTVAQVDISAVNTNTRTLVNIGTVRVDIQNLGGSLFDGSFDVMIFEDSNMNGDFDSGVDNVLGEGIFSGSIDSAAVAPLDVSISGVVMFLDNLIYALVDSADQIPELDEENNLGYSGQSSKYQPPVGDFLPLVEWQWNSTTGSSGVNHPPVVAPLIDTNGDGLINERDVPAVILASSGGGNVGRLVALRGDTGQEIFSVPNPNPIGWSATGHTPAVGDIDGDGIPEIVLSGFFRTPIFAFNNDGTLKWQMDVTDTNAANAVLADLDADGLSEIIYGAFNGTAVYNFDGSLRVRQQSPGNLTFEGGMDGARLVADLDLDGIPEIIAGPSAVDRDGNLLWAWSTIISGFGSEVQATGMLDGGATTETFLTNVWFTDTWTAAANLDADPNPEIIAVSSGMDTGGQGPNASAASMWIFEHDGRIHAGPFRLFQAVLNQTNFQLGPPCVADFDGDGQPEIAIAVHRIVTGPSVSFDNSPHRIILSVYEDDGTLVWRRDLVRMASTNTAPTATAFDFDGDGSSEVVFLDNQKLYIFDGSNGTTLFEMGVDRIGEGRPVRYPTIADVDNDGNAEIIVPTWKNFQAGAPFRNGVMVLGDSKDNWLHSRRIWNQWMYHVTNVNEDAGIPRVARNNWQVHNSHREQSPIEGLDRFAAPDLTVSRVTINALNCPASVGITARIGNGGSLHVGPGIGVNFYIGDPDAGGTLIGAGKTTQLIAPGEFEDVTLDFDPGSISVPVLIGQIWATVNETPAESPTSSTNLSLLPHTWAQASGFDTRRSVPVNFRAHLGIDGVSGTGWSQGGLINNIDPGPDFYEVRFPFPVNATSVTIENNFTTTGFLAGTLSFSNGFSLPVFLDSNGEVTISVGQGDFPEQTDITWVRLTASSIKSSGASVSEFIVGGSFIEPKFRVNEGTGRLGNNKAKAIGPDVSPCDTASNLPPHITSAPPVTAETGIQYEYQALASDPNNDPLTFSLVPAPAGMTIDNVTGLVTWTPTDSQTGNHSVTVQVSDGRGGIDQQSFTIDVTTPAGANLPPEITSYPVTLATSGETYQYDVEATDFDGDVVIFSLLQSPAGAAIDPFTGLISWTPNSSQIGAQFFTVEALDGIGGNDTQSFAVAVVASQTPLPTQPQDLDGDRFDETVDCDDSNPDVNPGRIEIPTNSIDDDCNDKTPDTLSANSIACSIVTDKRSYNSNSLSQFMVTIQNLSPDLSIVGLQAHLTVRDPGGLNVFETILPVNTLVPNALFRSTIAFNTQTKETGDYLAILELLFGPVVVCQTDAAFSILSSTAQGNAYSGSITATPSEIEQGQNSTFSYQVSNIGNVDVATVPLNILVVEIVNGVVAQTLTDQTSLNMGASFSNTQNFNSSGVAPGDYLVILQGEGNGTNQTIDSDFLRINERSVVVVCPDDLTARGKCGRSGCKVQLVWTDIGADHYNVYRSTTPGGPYSFRGSTTSTYSTYLDTTVVDGTTYYYIVNPADGNDAEFCQSNEASATPTARIR